MIELKQPVNAGSLKNKVFGIEKPAKVKTLMPIFREYNRRIAALVGKDYAPGTLERYTTSLKHTVDFLKWQYKVNDIAIKEINNGFIACYDFYLRSEKTAVIIPPLNT